MNIKAKRFIALFMSFLLILALFAGCGKNKDSAVDSKDKNQSGSETKKDNKDKTNKEDTYVYVPEYTPILADVDWINALQTTPDGFVFVTDEVIGARRTFYDYEWNMLGNIDIDPSEKVGYDDIGIYEDADVGAALDQIPSDPSPDGEIHYDDMGNELKYNAQLDIFYYLASDSDVYGQAIYKMNIDGTGLEKLPDYKMMEIEEGLEGNISIQSLTVDGDGNIWVMESGNFYHYDEENMYVEDGNRYNIRKLSSTGAELANIDLASLIGEREYVYFANLAVDSAGNLLIVDTESNVICILSPDGEFVGNIEMGSDKYVNELISINGKMYASYWGESGNVMVQINADSRTTGEEITLPSNAYQMYIGGVYDFYYTDYIDLYGYNIEKETSEKIFNWIDIDVNVNDINSIIPQKDGTIMALSYVYDYRNGSNMRELIKFTKVPASEIPDRTIIEIACEYLDYNLRAMVIDYNKSNDKYRIKVNDYSQFNTEEDYNAGITKLSTEIIAGDVPDIIMLSGLPYETYKSKGLLEDIYPYIKGDAELADDVMYEAFKPIQSDDGKLYAIASGYTIRTLAGAKSIVGDRKGWSIKDLEAALTRMPQGAKAFSETITRSQLVSYIFSAGISDYIDWDTGKCNFANDEFKDLLTYVAPYPAEINWDEYYGDDYNWQTDSDDAKVFNGQQMLIETYISDFRTATNVRAMFHNQPVSYIGYPGTSGNGSLVSYTNLMAMSSSCADKEGAWDFMRNILMSEYQINNVWEMRTNKTAFEKAVDESLTIPTQIDENGNVVPYPNMVYIAGQEIEVDYMTRDDVNDILSILDGATAEISFDNELYDIITEEAEAFFSGQKSVDDVCNIIQSRVNIYISTNM